SGPTKGAVEIDAGHNDHITVEIASLPVTATAPTLNWLLFSGQNGRALASSGALDQWTIDGQGKGTLDGLRFTGFTKLEDASGSHETFVWQQTRPVKLSVIRVRSGGRLTV